MKKKLVIPVLIASMLGSSVTALGANFSDINDVPWEGAKTYINKVADLGLVVGSKDSSGKLVFKSKNNLTYLECSQLVYAMFKNNKSFTAYSDAVKTKWQSVLKGYNITDWAWEAVSFCLENNIVAIGDVSGFMSGKTSKNASRQDVAMMFGKAMEKAGYTQTQAVTFNDASKIASSAIKYVNLLGSLSIITGDNNKNFNPTNPIIRAEMAVIVSNVYEKINGTATNPTTPTTPTTPTSNGSVMGIVSSASSYGSQQLITLLTAQGQKSFIMSAATVVTYNGKSAKITDIGEGDTITVTYSGTTILTAVINNSVSGGTGGSVSNEEIYNGTLTKVTSSKITVKKGSDSRHFSDFTDNMEIIIDGETKSYSKLQKAFEEADDKDKEVEISVYVDKNGQVYKLKVSIEGNDTTGDVESASKKKIKVDGKTYYFPDDEDDVTIKINGSVVSISEFVDGYDECKDFKATVNLDRDDKIGKLTVTSKKYSGGDISGKVTSISKRDIKVGGKTYKFADEDDMTRIRLNDSKSTLRELIDAFDKAYDNDDEVTAKITVNGGKVYKIELNTKTSSSGSGEIKSISRNKIKVGTKTYEIDEDPTVKIENGKTIIKDYSDLRGFFNDVDSMESDVTVTTSKDYVSKITGKITSISGAELRSVDSKNDEITLRIDSTSYDYEVKSSCTIKIGSKTGKDLDDLGAALDNDDYKVDITLNSSGVVTKITATKNN